MAKNEHIANGIVTTILVHLSTSIVSYSNIGSEVGVGVGILLRWIVIVDEKVMFG